MPLTRIMTRQMGRFLLVLLVGSLYGFSVEAEPKAPDFILDDIYGEKVSLKDYRGKIVLLDFWATWCTPCRMAVPELVKIQKNYRNKGLVILAISLDDENLCNDQCLLDYKKEQKLNFKILRSDLKVMVDYFGTPSISIPTSIIVNEDGKIVSHHQGYVPGLLERELKKLI